MRISLMVCWDEKAIGDNVMYVSSVCCQKLPVFPNAKSPFSKIIALDWHDRVTYGFLQCEVCFTSYLFKLLDIDPDWNEGLDVKIFSLSEICTTEFEQLVEELELLLTPAHWHIWCPIWTFKSQSDRIKVERKIRAIEFSAISSTLLVAASELDKEIITAKKIDWFALLELSRKNDQSLSN